MHILIYSYKVNYANHDFLKEICLVMDVPSCGKIIKYTVFEDNNRAIELAKAPKTRPYTESIAIKYQYFRTPFHKWEIIIEKVDTAE